MAVAQDGRGLDVQRREFQSRISTALAEEDDPLAIYVQYVQWITKNYAESDPQAGLTDVLKLATDAFKGDATYKSDLRYLKLWVLYARQLDLPTAINMYATLAKQHIGTSYSLLYEEYARSLERVGRTADADRVYRMGIKRQVRPLERLKTRYQDFQSRNDVLRPPPAVPKPTIASVPPPGPTSSSPQIVAPSTRESRYAIMLAPLAPGRRPEKLEHDTSLLFTPEGVEYCAAEARARSMGLLGKKWAPLPTGRLNDSGKSKIPSASSSSSVRLAFDADYKPYSARRKSMLNGEPTVTINTKEALADVFGMYNSPEKTVKVAKPGSKHAPLRKIESLAAQSFRIEPDKSSLSTSQSGGFKIFMDEEAKPPQKENKATSKFQPFIDSAPSNTSTPGPPPKSALAPAFEPRTPANDVSKSEKASESTFSSIFTPASKTPLRDVYTEAHGKPQQKALTHERAKSFQDAPKSESRPMPKLEIFVDENVGQETPFKVFRRPGEGQNPFTPKTPAFTPLSDKPTFTPFRDEGPPQPERPQKVEPLQILAPVRPESSPQPQSHTPDATESTHTTEESDQSFQSRGVEIEGEDEDDYGSSFVEEEYEEPIADQDYDTPIEETAEQYAGYADGGYPSEVPLGGRFGQFNVMTPITERTLEYTSSRSVFNTPTGRTQEGVPEDDEEEGGYASDGNVLDRGALGDVEEEEEDWQHPAASDQPWRNISQYQDDTSGEHSRRMEDLQEHTGQLSLVDALTLKSKFHPPNPCNPFDPSVMLTLLSLIPTDSLYHDMRHQESNTLDGLQKFAKKLRKTSSGSASSALDPSSTFPVALGDERYTVSAKLGEGGFGAVFQAQSVPIRDDEDDTEVDFSEEEEEEARMVAIKVVKPRNLWEYHVLRKLHSSLPKGLRRSVVYPHSLYAFRDESFLVLEFCPQGTLLDVVTKAVAAGVSQQGACLDELLVMFFAIELMRLIEGLHNAGFIHGDLKIDNCLLRLEDVPGGGAAWAGMYDPSGEHGWNCKGIKLIDFGRTISTRLFPTNQQFVADWTTDDRDCFEVRENRPWTYQTDYFGLAGIVYCLLFGKYMQASSITTNADGSGYRIATPFKRYWQTEIWGELFEICLNPCRVREGGELPVSKELGEVRRKMEEWLKVNCNRTSGTLKGLLKKVEMSCLR